MEQAAGTCVLRRERLLVVLAFLLHAAVLAGRMACVLQPTVCLRCHLCPCTPQTPSTDHFPCGRPKLHVLAIPFLTFLSVVCFFWEPKTKPPALPRVHPTTRRRRAPATRRTTHCVLPSPLQTQRQCASTRPPNTAQLRQQLCTNQFVLT